MLITGVNRDQLGLAATLLSNAVVPMLVQASGERIKDAVLAE